MPPFSLSPSLIFAFGSGSAILIVASLGIALSLWLRIRRLERELRLFFGDKGARDLESILVEQRGMVKTMDEDIQELFEVSNRIYALAERSLHKSSVMRFNPFKEVGGNQSFAVALLDGKKNGVVISSLHTREGTRVYAKPVKHGEADGYPLTEEEKRVINEADARGKEKTV